MHQHTPECPLKRFRLKAKVSTGKMEQ